MLFNTKAEAQAKYQNIQRSDKEFQGQGLPSYQNTGQKFTEKYDTNNMTNKDLLMANKKQKDNMDERLDMLNDNVLKIKHVAVAIGDELDRQEPMLDELEDGID